MLSDAEVICTFMEPKPEHPPIMWNELSDPRSHSGWWRGKQAGVPGNYQMEWAPGRTLTLDALREVQERLTRDQWDRYYDALWAEWQVGDGSGRRMYVLGVFLLHATAAQKITALASALRPLSPAAPTCPHCVAGMGMSSQPGYHWDGSTNPPRCGPTPPAPAASR